VLNGLLGFFQEERAGQALAALRKLSSPLAKVLRDGKIRQVPARDLVPGDIIELEAGDNVPADARLLQSFSLRVQESSLTGESTPVVESNFFVSTGRSLTKTVMVRFGLSSLAAFR